MTKINTPAQIAEKFITVGRFGAKIQHLAWRSDDAPFFCAYTLCGKKTDSLETTGVEAACKACQQRSLDPSA
jgi:hypothetical protein